jgi:hypothetical protein
MKELIKKHLFGKTKQEIEDKQDQLMHFEVSLDNREEYLNKKQDEHAEIVTQDLKRLQATSNELDKRQKALTKKEEDVFFKEFDLNDNEFFLEYDTLDEYWQWCEKEKHRVGLNKYCSSCEYYGNCLSEHLREVKSLDESCNGFKHLIDWYKNDRFRMEN